MEKKVIDLEVIDELQDSGVDAIALVDSPAIEKNWMFFRKEQFVEPQAGESESDYMGRCISNNIDEGQSQEQAVAVCISKWQSHSAMEFAKVSFDFDDTLSTDRGLELAKKYKDAGDTLYIISARNEVSSGMLDRASELGIPESRVYATGSNKAKVEKVKDLNIDKHIDNNVDVIAELGGLGEKFEINTGGLAPYTQQTPKNKKDLVEKSVDLSKVLEFAKTVGFAPSDFTENGMEFNAIPEGFDLELAKGYTVYKYSGSVGSDTRDFCREMVGLDRFYTFEEIDAMGAQAVNPGFGLGGASTYSIWDWKGGPNCKHRWQKFYVTAEGTFENKGPAPGKPGDKPEDMPNSGYAFSQTKMLFADESKHEIVGIAMVPDMEIPRKDKDGNIYFVKFSKDVIAKIAEKFMREQRLSATNIQHVDNDNAGSYVFESWITETETDKANSIYGLDAPIGSWVVKMRVTDETTWNKVKAGELKGLSIQGNFVSQEEFDAYMADKKMYTDLVDLIKCM
jgi:hypothetical protein